MPDSDYVAALKREREGYERYGRADRVKMVDDEIRRAGRASKAGDVETATSGPGDVERAVPKRAKKAD